MTNGSLRPRLINLSVEEQNLAAIPFAILEQRVGKRIGKLELEGVKILPDGREVSVVWQVQGNNDLGLPTEQDLDIFVALGVMTFRNNFQKVVTFTGREVAKILGIGAVHGKFYQRLKLAMDRFIPLRFRAIMSNDRQEEVKWLNVFQEASFSLDRVSGRCVGSVTWTDKLIQSMDSGFFRALDAGRYMSLDGITAKHLYRYLAVAFEKTNLIVCDARKLATQHLGIVKVPKYFSRLLQTLEPAFEQLSRIQVLASYHVVSSENWTIALHRHPSYMPETTLLLQTMEWCPDLKRTYCEKNLERVGLPYKLAAQYAGAANTRPEFYALERAARLLEGLREEQVLPHVALNVIRRALDAADTDEGRDALDWCEIALEICRQKRTAGQTLRNAPGLLIKLIKDPAARPRVVDAKAEAAFKDRFREREHLAFLQDEEAEERSLIVEYDHFRQELSARLFSEMNEQARRTLRNDKTKVLGEQPRFERMPPEVREREVDDLILRDLAAAEAPPYEKWRLRKRAEQAVLPFMSDQPLA